MLEERHLQQLKSSAISPEIVAERGYRSIPPGSLYDWRQLAGQLHSDDLLKKVLHQGALAFPLYRVGAENPFTWVLRPDQPRKSRDNKDIKYEYPKGRPNILDILPRYRAALGNPAIDIWLTEGAKKADALATAYEGLIVPVNENGVWGWRSKGRVLDDFRSIVWEGRRVILAPDGDVKHNKQVYQAVQRSARLFTAWGAAEVLILLLPSEKNGPKIGVDDYLAQGHTIDELEAHLVELTVVGEQTRVSLMRHPTTNLPLYLPPGYDVANKTIVRRKGEADALHLYTGLLAVTETGINPHNQEESVTIAFDRFQQMRTVTVPRAAITSGMDCARTLGAQGANVHSINGREVSRYLIEFIRENENDIPQYYHTEKLGNIQEGVVLPAGAIGFDREVRYSGPQVQVGTDWEIYPRVLREVATWGDNLVTLWGTLALALAGPILNRMKPDRNPVVLLANASGSGKSTVINFAIGAYGDPLLAPLRHQCGNPQTKVTGIIQAFGQASGIPMHLEDIHQLMNRNPDSFAGLIYDFANGQLRTYGQVNQQAGGGTRLGGSLLMTGEAVPSLEYEGSQKRLMTINCGRHLPLGEPPQSEAGKHRAQLLATAWKAGAGTLGYQVCELIWSNWAAFQRDVALMQADSALVNTQAWGPLLATAAQTLRLALLPLGINLDWALLLRQWAALYTEGQRERNPAQVIWDKVMVMLSQCELSDDREYSEHGQHRSVPRWQWLHYERKMVAARRVGEDYWRVLTTSPQWRLVVGENAVDMFGDTWLKEGLLVPHKGTRPVSDKAYTGPGKGYLQCILIPDSQLPMEEDEYETEIGI